MQGVICGARSPIGILGGQAPELPGEERDMFRRLRLDFQTLDAFQSEYQAYVERGELFVPTKQELGLREVVDLELGLGFCQRVVTVQAEVHGFRDWKAERSRPGVSVRLLEPIQNLQLAVADSTGLVFSGNEPPVAAPAATPPQGAPAGVARRGERSLARVTVTADSGSVSSEGATQDLSASGALLVLEDAIPPVDSHLELVMFHPTTDATQKLRARVVRHAKLPSGDLGIGVEFDFSSVDEEEARRFLEEVRVIEVDPKRRAETITGSIDVLGLPTLVQMFAASVGEGTITLVRGQDRGRVVFSGGTLRYARTGDVTGVKALCRLLGWQSGVFHFAPCADVDEPVDETPVMHRALFECIQKLDELARLDISGFPLDQRIIRTDAPEPALEAHEAEVLAFIKQGASVGDVIDGLPMFDVDIYQILERLLELNLIDIDIEV